jgi:hypothetical protein
MRFYQNGTHREDRVATFALIVLSIFVLTAGGVCPLQAQPLAPTTQKWTAGWDNFGESLNYTKSNVVWSVSSTSPYKMTVTFNLVGATPNKLYQVGFDFFCSTFPTTFGQFPPNGICIPQTHQSITLNDAWVEVGVVLTDIHGNGKFSVVIGPIAAGTYKFEFHAREGAGCYVNGGGGNGLCAVDFQSPGPTWGDATTITIP